MTKREEIDALRVEVAQLRKELEKLAQDLIAVRDGGR